MKGMWAYMGAVVVWSFQTVAGAPGTWGNFFACLAYCIIVQLLYNFFSRRKHNGIASKEQ